MSQAPEGEQDAAATERPTAAAATGPLNAPVAASAPGHRPDADPGLDVFVSYASPDAALADAIVATVERHGLRCWIAPRDVVPGSLYADGIVRAINSAQVFVLVLSGHAVASPHVGKEIERASSKRRPIIALRTDLAPLTPAFEYFLSESQWIDLPPGGTAAAATKLVAAIRRHRDPTRAPEPRGQPAPPAARPARNARPSTWAAGGIAVLALALAYFVADKFRLSWQRASERPVAASAPASPASSPATAVISEQSVAVLPFVDMSEKQDQEYFSDGLSEELIDMLTKVPGLRVPARTSSFYFKGKATKIAEVGQELRVAHVLEGSVRKAGHTVRITAQLIRVDNGYHVWSQTYDRQLDDIFKVQDEIAAAVVKALQVSLLEGTMPRAPTVASGDAYNLVLQGRFLVQQLGGVDSLRRAVESYEQALRIDPKAVSAWAGLSRALISLWTFDRAQQQYRERAVRAAERALALDPRSADAHVALGKIRLWADWDWAAADAEFNEARALDPRDSYANFFSGELAFTLGKATDALELYTRAIDQDPLNFSALEARAQLLVVAGRVADGLAGLRRLAELKPDLPGIGSLLGREELRAGGDAQAALAKIEREPDDDERLWSLAWAYATLGRRPDADGAIARYAEQFGAVEPFAVAQLYAVRGDGDRAFLWLDRAYQQRDSAMVTVKLTSHLANIRGDPRYKALLRKMRLPE